jgi:hypothetical protein
MPDACRPFQATGRSARSPRAVDRRRHHDQLQRFARGQAQAKPFLPASSYLRASLACTACATQTPRCHSPHAAALPQPPSHQAQTSPPQSGVSAQSHTSGGFPSLPPGAPCPVPRADPLLSSLMTNLSMISIMDMIASQLPVHSGVTWTRYPCPSMELFLHPLPATR